MSSSVQIDLIAQQWAGFEAAVVPPGAPDIQRKEMRIAFFGGAAALLATIGSIMDPGEEPTERDEAQMAAIHDELDTFAMTMALAALPTAGRS